nr:unnamed protein product [Digitaria exilis]
MRHLLLPRLLLRRRGSSPTAHHLPLLRALSSAPSPVSSDADLRKYAGYALLLLGCGAATYYSFPFPADARHKKAVPFRYAPLPEDLHAVSNWSATHEVHARVLLQPDSLQALEDALATAHKERRKLRPLGSGLSPNGIGLSRAGMVSLALMDKVLHVDAKNKTVTVQAGIRVAELVDALREHGLTLQNFASIREQQVGGFIQVGAHGTGATLPPVDEQVISMKLVTPAKGTIELSREKDPELFYLARCGLGGLGVVAEVTLQCVERHQLVEHTFVSNADEVKKNHKKWLSENKHIKYLWIPYTDTVVVVQCNPPSKWRAPKLTSKYGKDEALQHVRSLYRESLKKYRYAHMLWFDNPSYNATMVGIIMYLPTSDARQRKDITEEFFSYRSLAQSIWDDYSAYEHWAKIEVPKDKDELAELQARLRRRFPVDAYNKARMELDPNKVLSNAKLEKLFPVLEPVHQAK